MRQRTAARPTAILVSVAVHGLLVAAMASVRLDAPAPQPRSAGPECTTSSVTLRLVPRAPEPETVVAVTEPQDRRALAAPRVEPLTLPETVADEPRPPVLAEPAALPPAPSSPLRPGSMETRLHLASARPGRGGSTGVAGPSAAPSASIGVGASGGTAGGGTLGGGGSGGRGGAFTGTGLGAGSDGAGSGWSAPSGPTRGPAVVGTLTPPAYPSRARSRGWEGRVVLCLSIDETGRVVAASVVELSGRDALDDAARETAFEWRLAPALADGRAVPGTLRIPVRFELTD